MAQRKFKGGFMVDANVGRYIRMKGGRSLSINLTINNLLNNTDMCTGGYEQSRSDYSTATDGTTTDRTYKFSNNPKKFYAQGINGMLNLNYRF